MTKKIECTMTVVAQWPLEDSREEYDPSLTDEEVMAEDRAAIDDDLCSVWDFDSNAKISYEWRLTDDA